MVCIKRGNNPQKFALRLGVVLLQVTCHPLLWTFRAAAGSVTAVFELAWFRPALAWLQDHRVQQQAVLPGAALLEMVAAAGKASFTVFQRRMKTYAWSGHT